VGARVSAQRDRSIGVASLEDDLSAGDEVPCKALGLHYLAQNLFLRSLCAFLLKDNLRHQEQQVLTLRLEKSVG
jgi:hypothetical protein